MTVTGGKEFFLRVTEDRLAVFLDCTVPEGDLEPLLTRIENELAGLGLAEAPDRARLEEVIRREAARSARLTDTALVEGQRPVLPRDGRIEWAGDFFSPGFAVDEKTGIIDWWRRVAQPAVVKGQLLASVVPPEPGQEGRDVFGKRLLVPKPKPARIRAGSNIRMDEAAQSYYANADGRVRWSPPLLAVDSVWEIHGNVGIETGHIEHSGAVLVHKDVESDLRIKAQGDIEVRGLIEASEIETEGSLTVRGGIAGASSGHIKVGGTIHAKFILDAQVEADGDIVVEKEIVQSTIRTRGAICMPSGRLVGGEATALGGITVGQSGSEALVPTLLIVAKDFTSANRIAECEAQIAGLKQNLEKIHMTIDPLVARQRLLSAERREAVTELLAKVAEIEGSIQGLRAEIEQIEAASRSRSKPRVVFRDRVYPETVVVIGKMRLHIRDTVLGPVRAEVVQGRLELVAD